MKFRGKIDFVDNRSLSGWVFIADAACPIIKLFVGDVAVASVIADKTRRDFANSENYKSFRIEFSKYIAVSDLFMGRAKVMCVVGDEKFSVTLWEKLVDPSLPKPNTGADLPTDNIGDVLQIGTISDDDAAIFGHNSYFFLYQGNNKVKDLYERKGFGSLGDRWKKIIDSRYEEAAKADAKFVQIFIPEKSSAYVDWCPYPAQAGSNLWRDVVGAVKNSRHAPDQCIDVLDVFEKFRLASGTFRMQDSHLSTFGCKLITDEMLSILRVDAKYQIESPISFDLRGDLSSKFFPQFEFAPERNYILKHLLDIYGDAIAPNLVQEHNSPTGHIGTARVWHTPGAPVNKRIVCFGNSFFEKGRYSFCLSWWFARLFREFHFIWSPDVDWTYVQKNEIEIVVGQTIERFLGRVPIN